MQPHARPRVFQPDTLIYGILVSVRAPPLRKSAHPLIFNIGFSAICDGGNLLASTLISGEDLRFLENLIESCKNCIRYLILPERNVTEK